MTPYTKEDKHERNRPSLPSYRPSWQDVGGQYAPAIGSSTRDKSDKQDQQERLADFNAALEQARYGTVAGREW